MFAEVIAAGFDVLTYFKGSWARSDAADFTTTDCTAPDGSTQRHELAERPIELVVPAKGWPEPMGPWPTPSTTPASGPVGPAVVGRPPVSPAVGRSLARANVRRSGLVPYSGGGDLRSSGEAGPPPAACIPATRRSGRLPRRDDVVVIYS